MATTNISMVALPVVALQKYVLNVKTPCASLKTPLPPTMARHLTVQIPANELPLNFPFVNTKFLAWSRPDWGENLWARHTMFEPSSGPIMFGSSYMLSKPKSVGEVLVMLAWATGAAGWVLGLPPSLTLEFSVEIRSRVDGTLSGGIALSALYKKGWNFITW